MESKWHQMEVPNCSKIKSKWRAIERATERSEGASEWVVANCHAVSCMQRTCSISIEIFLKLWASKKKSLCESYLNQINIRSFESIALPVPYQDRFMLSAPKPIKTNAFSTFSLKLTFSFHTSFWTSFWVSLGSLLAPFWLPKGLLDLPNCFQMEPKCAKMEVQNWSKLKKTQFSETLHFSIVF